MIEVLALILAAVPTLLFLANWRAYRSPGPGPSDPGLPRVSVLIPARDEEETIAGAVLSVLENRHVDLELIVLDDDSQDATARIVSAIAGTDGRLRLEKAPPLPSGWSGKQHACHCLATMASGEFLVFMDADVRLEPDALGRMVGFLQSSGAGLASGVPRQELGGFSERLLLPLIHFVLLGFLPIRRMRRTLDPAFSAGCGQLFVARRRDYVKSGGHAAIRETFHDGLRLPRAFREAGVATDLFDATDVASCRMYRTGLEVWRGLSKNATEGLGAPGRIVPITLLLAGGQVLPFVLLLTSPGIWSACAVLLAWLPRWLAIRRFHQSLLGALLHPLGILALLAIQWVALLRKGKPVLWKGRAAPGPA